MSITAAVKKATRRAFKLHEGAGGELKKVKYIRYGASSYSPVTKTATRSITAQYVRDAFVTSFTEKEILAGTASPEDQRVTFEGAKITWPISIHDRLLIDGLEWQITRNRTPLTGAVVILQAAKV